MSAPNVPGTEPGDGAHSAAAAAFAERVRAEVSGVTDLFLFGSTARGEASGLGSDVDFLAVVCEDADVESTQDRLRAVAYDVMLEYGPVVEVHVRTRAAFEERHRQNHPFVRRVLRERVACLSPGPSRTSSVRHARRSRTRPEPGTRISPTRSS